MTSLFNKKIGPRVLTVEQIDAAIRAHRFGGRQETRDGEVMVCYCGRRFADLEGLRRHVAEEIAALQKP